MPFSFKSGRLGRRQLEDTHKLTAEFFVL